MKMVKRTLIALALVALLGTSVQAALEEFYFEDGDHAAVKVDGKDTPTFKWPYEWSYKSLDICTIPIKMEIGMYVQIIDCGKKKIVLKQVDCGSIGQGGDKYPCYEGCVDLGVRSNFPVVLGTKLNKNDSGVIKDWKTVWDGDDNKVNGTADGTKNLKLCVQAWEAQIFKKEAGDEVPVGSVTITVKPQ
jgi:hypothetical protein